MSSPQDRLHAKIKRSNADPDDGNSWLCSACRLPIFSTPYIRCKIDNDSGTQVILHEQCASLPKELKDCELHPEKPLLLRENEQTSDTTCTECSEKCGTKLYYCPDPDCGFQLDVACALTIKILHRSHEHRLVAIRAGDKLSSVICRACGTKHEASTSSGRSYLCNACGFWIHPDCAKLPNAIDLPAHEHPLVLNYDSRAPFGPESSTAISFDRALFRTFSSKRDQGHLSCGICGVMIGGFGMYYCIKCPYYVHIMCAVSDRESFKSVLIREAQLPHLVRLPIPDERKSLMHYVKDSISSGADSVGRSDDGEVHRHPLKFHGSDDINIYEDLCVCDACVKFILSPFHSCPQCPNFFLHDSCVHLPAGLTPHPAHHEEHPLLMISSSVVSQFYTDTTLSCSHCNRPFNTFCYFCLRCDEFQVDVSCALMPASITHDAHGKTHILCLLAETTGTHRGVCDCCGKSLEKLGYECRTCHNFALHTWCAMFPNTVCHKFDPHPLELITTTLSESSSSDTRDLVIYSSQELICEICENEVKNEFWYYGCKKCDQSFHIDCIPCLDQLSNIKFGSINNSNFQCHGSPLTLIRGLTIRGYRCDCCRKTFNDNDKLAFECSKCDSKIHLKCLKKYKPAA